MSLLREAFVTFKIDAAPYVIALQRAVELADRVHQSIHRAGIAITRRGEVKRVRAHRARCTLCSPMANPRPLTIDGHEYARRRKGRSRR